MGARAWCERCRTKEGARTISSTTVRASESRWAGSRLRNLRRRAAPHATRMSLPGMVVRGIAAAGPERIDVTSKSTFLACVLECGGAPPLFDNERYSTIGAKSSLTLTELVLNR